MGTQKLISVGVHRVRNAVVNRQSWDISLSTITSGVHRMGQGIGHQVIIMLLRIDRIAGNAYCVGWILQNITDPEAIDSAVCLAGTIRWFDSNTDVDVPFDAIVSVFEGGFGSN